MNVLISRIRTQMDLFLHSLAMNKTSTSKHAYEVGYRSILSSMAVIQKIILMFLHNCSFAKSQLKT